MTGKSCFDQESGLRRRKDARDEPSAGYSTQGHGEGHSIRSVAAEIGVSRNTVRKYLEESEPVRRIDELLEEVHGRSSRKQRLTG